MFKYFLLGAFVLLALDISITSNGDMKGIFVSRKEF